eukprot:scaffold192916_cov31-Tisochrysis_lutea.AAC.2
MPSRFKRPRQDGKHVRIHVTPTANAALVLPVAISCPGGVGFPQIPARCLHLPMQSNDVAGAFALAELLDGESTGEPRGDSLPESRLCWPSPRGDGYGRAPPMPPSACIGLARTTHARPVPQADIDKSGSVVTLAEGMGADTSSSSKSQPPVSSHQRSPPRRDPEREPRNEELLEPEALRTGKPSMPIFGPVLLGTMRLSRSFGSD